MSANYLSVKKLSIRFSKNSLKMKMGSKTFVTSAMIAEAIAELHPFHFPLDIATNDLFNSLKSASWQSSGSIWYTISSTIFRAKDPRTIRSYVPMIYKTFLRHFDNFQDLTNALLQSCKAKDAIEQNCRSQCDSRKSYKQRCSLPFDAEEVIERNDINDSPKSDREARPIPVKAENAILKVMAQTSAIL